MNVPMSLQKEQTLQYQSVFSFSSSPVGLSSKPGNGKFTSIHLTSRWRSHPSMFFPLITALLGSLEMYVKKNLSDLR
jgi:hypothetical protein